MENNLDTFQLHCFLLSLALLNFGYMNQQCHCLKSHTGVYATESQVWEADSFLVHEANHQIIQNIYKFWINAYVCLPLPGQRSPNVLIT